MGLGNRVYGAAGIALGVIGLIWGDFAAPWHAVPAGTPGHAALAYACAALLLIGGLAMQLRRSAATPESKARPARICATPVA